MLLRFCTHSHSEGRRVAPDPESRRKHGIGFWITGSRALRAPPE